MTMDKYHQRMLKRGFHITLTVREIADILGISRQRVEQLLRSGLKKVFKRIDKELYK